jgi:DNA-binding PucR family transcriptional regulator
LGKGERASLLETLRAWLAANGSTAATATALHVHRNTVRNRLDRIEEVLQRRLTEPRTLAELYAAMEVLRMNPPSTTAATAGHTAVWP